MCLFLITSLSTEGMYESDFQVVEADSRLAIAQHMLENPHLWENYLSRARPKDWRNPAFDVGTLWDCVHQPSMTAQRFLELIEMTSTSGEENFQLRIVEVNPKKLAEVDTNPFKRKFLSFMKRFKS
jgi:hypothetical protein